MKCKKCNNQSFYTLKNGYIKCKTCAKKYSLEKIQNSRKIIEAFCNNQNALEVSKNLNVNYRTVKNKYDQIRVFISKFLEDEYNKCIKDYSQYEEYYYFKTKDKNKKNKLLHDAINIMGFYSNSKVYTILMPKPRSLNFSKDNTFENYLSWNKIHSQDSYKTKLKEFWNFLEKNIKKYKGIKDDYFFYYLKECEFRFNYEKDEQVLILWENF